MTDAVLSSARESTGPSGPGAPPPRSNEPAPPAPNGLRPAAAERACDLYEAGAPLTRIQAETGVKRTALYRHMDKRDLAAGRPPTRRVPPRAKSARARAADLAARLLAQAERQVAAIEARLPEGAGDPERDARALAVLARVIRELGRAGQPAPTRPRPASPRPEDEDAVPRDYDRLREELASRLARIREEREAGEAIP